MGPQQMRNRATITTTIRETRARTAAARSVWACSCREEGRGGEEEMGHMW